MTAVDSTSGSRRPVAAAHPLDPLLPEEIEAVTELLSTEHGLGKDPGTEGRMRVVTVEVAEPPKEVVRGWAPGDPWDRQAAVVLRDRTDKRTLEAVVSLSRSTLVSLRAVPGAQPPMMVEEFSACEEAVREDERWREAMRRRGVEDFSLAMIDLWAGGYTGPQDSAAGRRLGRPLTFVRSVPGDNAYARPVEGLVVTVDLDEMTVLDVIDHMLVPLPELPGNYASNLPPGATQTLFDQPREALRPIVIDQPDGPSFDVEGWAVRWSRWRLRLGFTPREGLVLHDVGYVDDGAVRPVLYRASLAEMYVPYGDPGESHWTKNVFDEGEYGLGTLANSLEKGCDCLGAIRYFDAHVNDQDGRPVRIPNAVCMHEEDASIGWKHTDFRAGKAEVRRNRRLVISFIANIGNYDYGFYWYLYLDGSIEFEVKLTGIVSTGAVKPGERPKFGTLLAPGLYAPNHEHYFSVRLDMRVDSDRNNLYEVDSVTEPTGTGNPHGNAWRFRRRRLTCEADAQRLPDPLAGRAWLVSSADTTTALGNAPAYKIEPGPYTRPLWQEGSIHARRGAFATRQLWATPYDPAERFAAGDYVAQSPGGDGLPEYTAGNRSLEDADLVIWYTVGAHHIVRPEDWPVMPATTAGFRLTPFGFFDHNPMLDLPPEPAERPDLCC